MKIKSKTCSGLTLVEMMVAIGIFTMGIAGFTALFARSWQINHFTLETGQASMEISRGLNTLTNYIRSIRQSDNGSYPIVSGLDDEFTFYSDYDKDGVTERLRVYKSGDSILMGITRPTDTMPKTYPSGDQETVTIANYIVNDDSTPIFYYYNQDYPADTDNNPLATPVNVSSVRLVKIYLEINIDPGKAPENIKMQSFIELRNLNDYNRT